MSTQPETENEMRYLIVAHDEAWRSLEAFWRTYGVDLVQVPDLSTEDDPTPVYILSPRMRP